MDKQGYGRMGLKGVPMRKIDFICEQCKIDFVSKKACIGREPKFCSRECYGISIRKDRKCPVCSEHVTWNNLIYCSQKCASIVKKGKPLSEYHKQKLSEIKKGKRPKHLYTEEIKNKISKALLGKPQPWIRGENHPRYINGGFSKFERQKAMGRVEYKNWRRNVFQRDDYTCVLCQKKGTRLNADHIKPWALFPELRYEISNGRTLCISCHRKTETYGKAKKNKRTI